ncbi:hypothetical protein G6F57_018610 [Rhizopus arrhizus]|nr:hypothetical protein G6F57_018610 [Rhizopus arrhizus]
MVFIDGQADLDAAHEGCERLARHPVRGWLVVQAHQPFYLARGHGRPRQVVQAQGFLQSGQPALHQRQVVQRQMRNQPPVRGTALLEPVRVRRPAQHADGARHRAALQEQVAARLAHGDVRRQVTVSAGQVQAERFGLRHGGVEIDVDDRDLGLVARAALRHGRIAPHPNRTAGSPPPRRPARAGAPGALGLSNRPRSQRRAARRPPPGTRRPHASRGWGRRAA